MILTRCAVRKIDEQEKLVHIETDQGTYTASRFVYATHIPAGINLLHLRCTPYRSYAVAAVLENNAAIDGLVYDLDDPFHYYRTQKINDDNYLIVGGCDHKTGQEPNAMRLFRDLQSHVVKHFRVASFTHQWSSQYYEPADGLPYIGTMPGHSDKVLVATGFSGNGITYSQVATHVLHDQILGLEVPYQNIFSPRRIKPVASFNNMVNHNADVVKEFVSKWFTSQQAIEWNDLAPGEARVVTFREHNLAVFKDEGGELHAVDPACTHMKCVVSWNNAERSWDCPCHGTRFSYNGHVLNGPATLPLETISLAEIMEAENKKQ